MKKNRFYITIIFMLGFNLRFGFGAISPLMNTLQTTLNMSNLQTAIIVNIPVICMGIFSLLSSNISSKVGLIRTIRICVLLLGIGIFLRLFTLSYTYLVMNSIIIGFAMAIASPLSTTYIKSKFSYISGKMIGVYSLGLGTAAFLSPILIVILTRFLDGNWQLALAIFALPAFLTYFLWRFERHEAKQHEISLNFMLDRMKNMRVWTMIIYFGLQSGIFYTLITWTSKLIETRTMNQLLISYGLPLFVAIQVIISFITPQIIKSKNDVFKFLIFAVVTMTLSIITFLGAKTDGIIILAILLLGIGYGPLFPIALLLPLQETDDVTEVGVLNSVIQSFGYIIGGSIPIIIGQMNTIFIGPYTTLVCLSVLLLSLLGISFSFKKKAAVIVEK